MMQRLTRTEQRVRRRRLLANRANAAKSTGPRTVEGKAISSRNAITHGLLAETVRIGEFPEEMREVFDVFRDGIIEGLDPVGGFEQMLAERVVASAWRLRRAGRLEALLTRNEMERIQEDRELGAMLLDAGPQMDLALAVSRLFRRGCYEQLTKYETRIERGMLKTLHELQRQQRVRRGEDVPPPQVVDLDVTVG